jgi:hypothetical protein
MLVPTLHISSLEHCTLAAWCCGKHLGTIWKEKGASWQETLMQRSFFRYCKARYPCLLYLTYICHLWIPAMVWGQCTCTNIGQLSFSHWLSVNVTQVKGIASVSFYVSGWIFFAFPWHFFVLDKQVSDLCMEDIYNHELHQVVRVAEVQGSWQYKHSDESNI